MSARNTIANFEANFVPEPMSGCWLWTAYSPNGRYGAMKWEGSRLLAHVIAHKIYKGAVEAGKVVDHICRNTFCVNPDHLQAITQLENTRRTIEATKTHCVHGHPYTNGMDIYYRQDREGVQYRRCLTCYRLRCPGTTK